MAKYPNFRLLPNVGSKIATPASQLIDAHYASIGVTFRWDRERFTRLCNFATYVPSEVASLVGLPHSYLPHFERSNNMPLSAALLLTILEARLYQGLSTDIIPNPFPSLPHDPPQGT